MAKDALTIYREACELDMLKGARVDKVTMPDRETVILLMHTAAHGNHKLLLSCNPSLPRAHITTYAYKNPETATGNLMYFRKRLTGAALTDIVKERTERMITFVFSALDELRERVEYKLIAELTGKCADIIFVENGVIGNALRRITAEAEGKRAVLPGLKYAPPNPTGRVGIFDRAAFFARVKACEGVSLRAAVNKCVAGLAMTTVDELFYRLDISDAITPNDDAALARFTDAAAALYEAEPEPAVAFDNVGKPLDVFLMPYATCAGKYERYPTLNAAFDAYYSALFAVADLNAHAKPLRAAVRSAMTKNKKRLEQAVAKIAESENCESDRLFGELITANIYRIKRGDKSATLENWYEDGALVTVPLDETKNAQQNAAAYFKTYSKKKKAAVYAKTAESAAKDAIYRLEELSLELELCSKNVELDEVREELISLGLIRPDNKRKKTKPVQSEPYSTDVFGATLFVGKNKSQNDRITRGAAKTDIWLHVKDAHGSHAVLKTSSPTDEQIVRAAEIAAYYSSVRGADKTPVDYALIKDVHLHGGGRAEYFNYKTVIVKPCK